ncbi:leucine-rich repeat domain-containing protein [Ruminococcus sp. NK3A76]|uniref:leucine-rich repeat domain-containing protein n=1 Tax=Ruminococcus sp. NK3A76 TaxID=877411 RepID=UPI00048EE95A|nr:leucine-rich repeat domain-containing protein [Ruminococcus sp. NK3A76]
MLNDFDEFEKDQTDEEYDSDDLRKDIKELVVDALLSALQDQTPKLDISQKGNILQFDDAFTIKLPANSSFKKETDENYNQITLTLSDNEELEFIIKELKVRDKDTLDTIFNNALEGDSAYTVLYSSSDNEIGLFGQSVMSGLFKSGFSMVFGVRSGEYGVFIKAQYERGGLGLYELYRKDIEKALSLLDTVKFMNNNKTAHCRDNSKKLDEFFKMLSGTDEQTLAKKGVHCDKNTNVLVDDSWSITVPKGYKFSTDPDEIGNRKIVLGLDDGTLDLSMPFSSTINFSAIARMDNFSGAPLDSPEMIRIQLMCGMIMGNAPRHLIRQDSDIVVSYRSDEPLVEGSHKTFKFSGIILTRKNMYYFQFFDCKSRSEDASRKIIEQLLNSVMKESEYQSSPASNKYSEDTPKKKKTIVTINKDTVAQMNKKTSKRKIEPVADSSDHYDIKDGVLVGYSKDGTSAVIPEGVTTIGARAFSNRKNLLSVVIPNTVTKIEERAFAGCIHLTSIDIPDSVTELGQSALKDCNKITALYIPGSISVIHTGTIRGCSKLTELTFGEGVKSIEDDIAVDCGKLEHINIPASLESLSPIAFYRCNAIKKIIVSPDSKDYCSIDGSLYSKDKKELVLTPSELTEYKVREGTERINDNAFTNCSKTIRILEFPESLIDIPKCYSFTELRKVNIPSKIKQLKEGCFGNCGKLESVEMNKKLEEIGKEAFSGCYEIKELVLPETVNKIGEDAFLSCHKLPKINISANVTELPRGVMCNCKSLKSIEIPSGVKRIGNVAFACCENLESITIPITVSEIADNAFKECEFKKINIISDIPALEKELSPIDAEIRLHRNKLKDLLPSEKEKAECEKRIKELNDELKCSPFVRQCGIIETYQLGI